MSRRGAPSSLNVLIAVDKPLGLTSHDAVARVRRAVGEKRVGHAGTLDPAATGVLVTGIGQATKLLGLLTLDRKVYRARIVLGSETTTDDAEGEVTERGVVRPELLDEDFARKRVEQLVGAFEQVPPTYSAVSVDGRRAYDLARHGEKVELQPRHVEVYAARLLSVEEGEKPAWVVELDVSKGTYVRAIARDLGRELGCYAHLDGLVRVRAGSIGLEDCVSFDELDKGGAERARAEALDPVAALGFATRQLELAELRDVSCGRKIEPGVVTDPTGAVRVPYSGERVCLVWDGGLVGIWQRTGASLVCDTNFPVAIEGVRNA